MVNVSNQFEVTVRIGGGPAALGHFVAMMNSCGAAVLVAFYQNDERGTLVRLITDNLPRTTRALERMGFVSKAESIVLIELPDKPGLVAMLGAKLTAATIQVLYSYSFHTEDHHFFAVFQTADNQRAVYLLKVDALIHDVAAALSWHQPVPVESEAA